MALNCTKSDAILFGTSQRLKTISSLSSVKLDDSVGLIQLSDTVKILGATLDSSLTMGPHTKATSKSCFYHTRSFRQICSSMDHTMAISVALALVPLRLDYANYVLFGCPQKHAARVHLPVTYFLFHDTTSLLVCALSALLRPKYGTPYLFTSANLKLTNTPRYIFDA